jgi:hypothetical protein
MATEIIAGPINGGDDITNENYGKIDPRTGKVDNRRFIPTESGFNINDYVFDTPKSGDCPPPEPGGG